MENDPYLSIGKASKLIGVSAQTLRIWEKKGKLKFDILPSGHRRIHKSIIDNIQKSMKKVD